LVQKLVKAIGKNLAAHFIGAHGTLMCRGTPVEKHCFSKTFASVKDQH